MTSRRIAITVVAAAVVVATAAMLFLLRPSTQVRSRADPDVTVECTAGTGVDSAACLAWGDTIIAGDPPSFTFEMEDLVGLRLERSWFGFGSECHASYRIARYAEPAFTDAVSCAEAS